MSLSATELRAALQAILFLAGEPVKLEALAEAFSDVDKESVEQQLQEIDRWLREAESGFFLEQTAGGYRLATRPELDPFLRKFFSRQGEGRLSMAALETLAIIAYRQPITAPEVSELRGVNSSGVIRTLLERKMIRIAGRKNVVGSPFLYRTTRDFLVHFGLNSVQDLPRLEEFAEILGENLPEELIVGGDTAELSQDGSPAEGTGENADEVLEESVALNGETRFAEADAEAREHSADVQDEGESAAAVNDRHFDEAEAEVREEFSAEASGETQHVVDNREESGDTGSANDEEESSVASTTE